MYGQMTAGSWIYIGAQGIVQGTYETFVEMGRQHYDGNLAGKWLFTGGLGGMGGAQPLAAVMAGASCLAVECRRSSIDMRLRTGYLDTWTDSLDEALRLIEESCTARKPLSVGLLGNVADVLDELLLRGIRPDLLTDQTSAHDPVNGYLPQGWSVEEWDAKRVSAPKEVEAAARDSMANHIRAMLTFHALGVPTVDYGNNLRQMALEAGVDNAFDFPGFVPAYIRPLFCRGIGPFRWVALSGDPDDIAKTDAKVKELIPDDAHLHRWLDMAADKIAFQGLPARICWVGLGDRHRLGLAFNAMVRSGELKAPVVIGRDHLDSGSVASPNRETEAMADGSDAVSDWPLLNALLNTASGATWVSLHHGGGVGMGFSQHAGMVIVCDGSEAADKRLERVLWNDPATGVMRHADAGYAIATDCAKAKGWICRAFCADPAEQRAWGTAASSGRSRAQPPLRAFPYPAVARCRASSGCHSPPEILCAGNMSLPCLSTTSRIRARAKDQPQVCALQADKICNVSRNPHGHPDLPGACIRTLGADRYRAGVRTWPPAACRIRRACQHAGQPWPLSGGAVATEGACGGHHAGTGIAAA